ncbi:hypothetical protein [Nocardiopsis alba]|uniref:hypothetical protein n=1 Tax=Nocardiopsis alba TaxID=53437 RepID=UPI0005A9819F|nr:hypothetical protein [Nocardiopsis alba]
MNADHRTVHLITVGVSLFDNLQHSLTGLRGGAGDRKGLMEYDKLLAKRVWGARRKLHDPESEQTADLERETQAAWLAEVTAPRAGAVRADLEALLAQIEPARWPAEASAELSSLAAHNLPSKHVAVPDRDTAILITSDTGKGLRASLFNAVALAGGDLNRVRYLHEPAEEQIVRERGNIVIARLPHLDVGGEKEFTESMRDLGRIGRGVDRLLEPENDVARFHLSGGFKAAMPFLLGLGEALRGLRGPVKVRAFALHELAPGLRSIELPLRSLPPKPVNDQLKPFEGSGIVGEPPQGAPLRGFAYDRVENGRTWRLTPFGEALRELHRDRRVEET